NRNPWARRSRGGRPVRIDGSFGEVLRFGDCQHLRALPLKRAATSVVGKGGPEGPPFLFVTAMPGPRKGPAGAGFRRGRGHPPDGRTRGGPRAGSGARGR